MFRRVLLGHGVALLKVRVVTCTCRISWDPDPLEREIKQCPLCAAAPDLLAACKAQHQALDLLLGMLVARDGGFPSKSPAWPAVVQGNAAIKKAEGRL